MLTLTKKSEYALVAICHLARSPTEVVSARDIAERYRVPRPLLMNVLKSLSQYGLVRSARGAHGGYSLNCDPSEVSLNCLIEAIEGPVRLVPCASRPKDHPYHCDRMHDCSIRQPLHRVHDAFNEFLKCITIADLAFCGDSQGPGFAAAISTAKALAP